MAAGADPNARTTQGATPLHSAARSSSNAATLDVLLDLGADPRAADNRGRLPIDYTVENPWLRGAPALDRLDGLTEPSEPERP